MIPLTVILSILFIMTLVNLALTPTLKNDGLSHTEKVSVLVPLRNEERHIKRLVHNLAAINYSNLEIIMLDDQSTDATYSLLLKETQGDTRFKILRGKQLPSKWAGKVYACHQLAEQASGTYYLYLDADVLVDKNSVNLALSTLKSHRAQMLTGFPRFPAPSLLAKLLVPMQHMLVSTFLPIYIANQTTVPAFTAAHGAFLFIERQAYKKSGGHKSIMDSLIDDVDLAKQLKKSHFRVVLSHITKAVRCDMYQTNQEVWRGFMKNVFIGVGRSKIAVVFITILFSFCFLVPACGAILGLFYGKWQWIVPLLIVYLHAFVIDWNAGERSARFLLQPLSVFALLLLLHASMFKALRQKGYEWKGRVYQ